MTGDLTVQSFSGVATEWDSFVRAQAGWTHFHLFGWKAVVENALGHECLYVEARDASGALQGVLPLVRVKSILFGHYLVSMPFVNYGGPLGRSAALKALARHATGEAQRSGAMLLELRSRAPLDLTLPVSHRKITVVLDLPPGEPRALWEVLPGKLRSQVRRPQKEGVVVRFGAEQREPFYGVFARHMRDLGTPVQARALFRDVEAAFPADVWFGCAYLADVPVAAGAGFRWGEEFEMTWAAALRAYNPIAPNMLLYWAFMERCVQEGVRVFNFGRCTPGGGTHRFKRQWGSHDVPLHWYQWTAGRADGTPSPDHGRYRMAARLWSRLPLAVANRLGPAIVRYIP